MARGSDALHSLAPENSSVNSSESASLVSRSISAMASALLTTNRGLLNGSGTTLLEKVSQSAAWRLSKRRSRAWPQAHHRDGNTSLLPAVWPCIKRCNGEPCPLTVRSAGHSVKRLYE